MESRDEKILANHYFVNFKRNLTLLNECFKKVSSQTPLPETERAKLRMTWDNVRNNLTDLQRVLSAPTRFENPIGIHPVVLTSQNPTRFKRTATLSDEMPLKKAKVNKFPPEWI